MEQKLKIRSQKVPEVPGKQFRENGKLHRLVRIYLEGPKEEIDKIKSVEYELHPTFRQRYRQAEDPRNQFEITIWTYGFFKIKATLFHEDKTFEIIEGFVRW